MKEKSINNKWKGVIPILIVILFFMGLFFLNIDINAGSITWHIETVPTPYGINEWNSMVLDSDGYPHIVYVDDDSPSWIIYVKWTGSDWHTNPVDVGSDADLVLDNSGLAHISYYKNHELMYARELSSGGWNIFGVDDSSSVIGWDSSITLDSYGYPHISYYDYTNGALKYAKLTSSGWSIETIHSGGSPGSSCGRYSSIVLDSQNRPYISYWVGSTNSLCCAHYTGSSWDIDTVDYGDCGGYETSIDLDSYNHPHISYYDSVSGDLKYAHYAGSSWGIETVDSSGNVGKWSSIKLDSSNHPHISYQDSSAGKLKYAKKASGSWEIEYVDTIGSLGGYTSIDLDNSNSPHIAYYDGINDALKYAYAQTVNENPIADANGPYYANPGESITFNAYGSYDPDGYITQYDWKFYDGDYWHINLGPAPTYIYSNPGTYTVTLKVHDNNGATDTDTTYVYIQSGNQPPVADADGHYYANPGETITFDASGSYDPDGYITQYDWKFYDGDYWHINLGPTPTYTYYTPGTYTVTLKVHDNNGATDTDTTYVYIQSGNHPPNTPSQPDGPTSGYTNTVYTYSTSTTDPDGDDIYYMFYWGDGTYSSWLGPYSSGHPVSASKSWNKEGTNYVKVKAKDIHGVESDWSLWLTVEINKNIYDFTYFPEYPTVGKKVYFIEPNPDGDRHLFIWDFGDGTIEQYYGIGHIMSHVYNVGEKWYNVILTVKDGEKVVASVSKWIYVQTKAEEEYKIEKIIEEIDDGFYYLENTKNIEFWDELVKYSIVTYNDALKYQSSTYTVLGQKIHSYPPYLAPLTSRELIPMHQPVDSEYYENTLSVESPVSEADLNLLSDYIENLQINSEKHLGDYIIIRDSDGAYIKTPQRTLRYELSKENKIYNIRDAPIWAYKYEVRIFEDKNIQNLEGTSQEYSYTVVNSDLKLSLEWIMKFGSSGSAIPFKPEFQIQLNYALIKIHNFKDGNDKVIEVFGVKDSPPLLLKIRGGFGIDALIKAGLKGELSIPLFSDDPWEFKLVGKGGIGGYEIAGLEYEYSYGVKTPADISWNFVERIPSMTTLQLAYLPYLNADPLSKLACYYVIIKLVDALPPEWRELIQTYTAVEFKMGVGVHKGVATGHGSLNFGTEITNNLYFPWENKYHIIYGDKFNLDLGGTAFQVLQIGGNIEILPSCREIHDPINDSSFMGPNVTITFLNDSPLDNDHNGIYEGISIMLNVTTNIPGNYSMVLGLSNDNTTLIAQHFIVSLQNGSNTVTLIVPGQYIYLALANYNYSGSFNVGCIISNDTMILRTNFTLGETNNYSYTNFEHIIPHLNVTYNLIDKDMDGVYENICFNISKNDSSELLLRPVITTSKWIIHLNNTTLAGSNTSIVVNGYLVRKLGGNFSLSIYIYNFSNEIYLYKLTTNIRVNSSKFQSEYPFIKSVVPEVINNTPILNFSILTPFKSNFTLTVNYKIGNTSYNITKTYFNISSGINHLPLSLSKHPFLVEKSNTAKIINAKLISDGILTDDFRINEGFKFNITSDADTLITGAVRQKGNIFVSSYINSQISTNATLVVVANIGNQSFIGSRYLSLTANKSIEVLTITNTVFQGSENYKIKNNFIKVDVYLYSDSMELMCFNSSYFLTDIVPPTTTKSIGSPQYANGTWVTSFTPFNLTAFDNISGVNATYYRIWYNGIWSNWTQYTGEFTLSGECKHYLEYYSVDNAGNVENVTNQTHYVDSSPPVTSLSYGSPYYTNGIEEWITTSTPITLTAVDEPECAVGVMATYYSINGGNWSLYTEPFTINEECEHTIEWYSIDYLGNVEQIHSTVVNVDSSPPVTSLSYGSPYYTDGIEEWITTSTPITLTAVDEPECAVGVMATYYSINGGNWSLYTQPFYINEECTHTIEYYSIDYLGNEEPHHIVTVNVDDSPPVTTIGFGTPYYYDGNHWITSDTPITLTAVDEPECAVGVMATYYRIITDEYTTIWHEYTGPFYMPEECEHTIEYYSIDWLGNVEEVKSTVVYVDNSPPEINVTLGGPNVYAENGWYVTSETLIDVFASDTGCNGGVGVDTIYYRIWYMGTWTSWTLYDGIPITLDGECVHYLEINATDLLGNTGFDNVTFYVDNSPPVSWLSGEMIFDDFIDPWSEFSIFVDDQGECEVGDYTIHFRITGPEGSMFYWFLDYYNCNGTWHTGFHSIPVSFQLRNEEGYAPRGIYTVEFWAEDDLGNAESPHNIEELKVDTVAPETTLSLDGPIYETTNVWISSLTQIVLTANDEDSGVSVVKYKIDDGIWHNYLNPIKISEPGMHTISYYSVDNIGNEEEEKSYTVYVDNDVPLTNLNINGKSVENGITWIKEGTTISFSSIDAETGVDAIYYRIDDGEWIEYAIPFTISTGEHVIEYYAVDNVANAEAKHAMEIGVDSSLPEINIDMPKASYLYIAGREIMPLPRFMHVDAIIIGKVNVKASASDECGINAIRIYINDKLEHQTVENSVDWTWNERAFGTYTITIEAEDDLGHKSIKETRIFVINLAG